MELKEIVNDWNKAFPLLKKCTDRKLYILCKPLLIGFRIETENFSWDVPRYSVIFEIIPLWGNMSGDVGSIPKPLISAKVRRDGARGRRYAQPIRFRDHDRYLSHAIECARDDFGAFLEDKIDFNKFINYIYKQHIRPYFKWHLLVFDVHSYTLLLAIGLYFDNVKLINFVKRCVSWESKYWNKNLIKMWEHELDTYFGDKEQFFARIEENCKKPKIAKLNVANFVGLDDFEPPKTFWDKFLVKSKLYKIKDLFS